MDNLNYYAEFETDKYIRETFFSDLSYKGVMIEVGAGPIDFYSMSKHFRENDWRCICIEPNPKFVASHLEAGNEVYGVACANYEGKSKFKVVETGLQIDLEGISFSALEVKYPMPPYLKVSEIEVEVIRLDTLLEKINVSNIDFISVDTEGWELEVIEGFNISKYNPKIVILENYANNSDYSKFMDNLGYELIHCVQYNWIFTKKAV